MREVMDDQPEALRRGRIAREYMLEHHSPAAAGASMSRRLGLIRERLEQDGKQGLNLAHIPSVIHREDIGELIARLPELEVGQGRLRRMKARAYRPVSNWAHAQAEHQRILEDAMQQEIERIEERLREVALTLQEQQRAQHAQTLAVLRRLQAEMAELRRGG